MFILILISRLDIPSLNTSVAGNNPVGEPDLDPKMTLSELARELNVSIATISRALNRPDDVAPSTRERILAAVHRNGKYQPGKARWLRAQQTRTIGVVVSDIRNPFFAGFVKSIEDIARANGYTVLVCNADEDPDKEEAALSMFLDRKVAGLINCSTGGNLELLRAVRQSGAAIIDFDRESGLENADVVTTDNLRGGILAVQHLISLGHRRIATIAGPQHLSNARARVLAYQKSLSRAGFKVNPNYIQPGNFQAESGFACAKKLFSLPEPPTAIFVANLEMCAGLITYVREKGIAVPEELSVVTFDDVFWMHYIDPPITAVAQPVEKMGRYTIELMLERLRGSPGAQRKVFAPKLILRRSTAPPKVTDNQ
ncbi:MAG: LacI family DNA-binding transcriptional regulator [Verrucomicrobia bacterium]|nr:LacI family DNA-binding transcriptional regulator [Verrucomicrobiota bacterium]